MKLSGEELLPCTPERAWELLTDARTLQACIPGCESVEETEPGHYTAAVVLKIGPIKARFTGEVKLTEIDSSGACRLTGKGSGGVAGFAEGGADLRLSEAEGGTLLTYEVDSNVGGKIAQLGARLIDSTAQKLAKQFFTNFSAFIQAQA
jgi:Uncharacterized conserved protein